MSNVEPEWQAAVDWLLIEHQLYEGPKWDTTKDDAMSAQEWREQVDMYLHRATILGLDNPLGRQAVGKAAATAVAYFESVIRVHKTVPVPGFPSGDLKGEFKVE